MISIATGVIIGIAGIVVGAVGAIGTIVYIAKRMD